MAFIITLLYIRESVPDSSSRDEPCARREKDHWSLDEVGFATLKPSHTVYAENHAAPGPGPPAHRAGGPQRQSGGAAHTPLSGPAQASRPRHSAGRSGRAPADRQRGGKRASPCRAVPLRLDARTPGRAVESDGGTDRQFPRVGSNRASCRSRDVMGSPPSGKLEVTGHGWDDARDALPLRGWAPPVADGSACHDLSELSLIAHPVPAGLRAAHR